MVLPAITDPGPTKPPHNRCVRRRVRRVIERRRSGPRGFPGDVEQVFDADYHPIEGPKLRAVARALVGRISCLAGRLGVDAQKRPETFARGIRYALKRSFKSVTGGSSGSHAQSLRAVAANRCNGTIYSEGATSPGRTSRNALSRCRIARIARPIASNTRHHASASKPDP